MENSDKNNKKRGKRNGHKTVNKVISLVGDNPAGIKSKWITWEKLVSDSNASIWFLQETKCQGKKLKMENFYIYEKVRKDGNGGGVAIAAVKEMNPAFISEGDDGIEAITIDIHAKDLVIACSSAYGPQAKAPAELKKKFWDYLDTEVDRAKNNGKGFILQGDLNARLGPDFIKNDPNPINENGKYFKSFLERHPHLTVVNSLNICEGSVTRSRKLVTGVLEESIIDFYVVCDKVLQIVTKMTVENQHILTNYFNKEAKSSDHSPVTLQLNLKMDPFKHDRVNIFDLKIKNSWNNLNLTLPTHQNLQSVLLVILQW